MLRSASSTIEQMVERKCSPRTAAMTLALSRLEKVYEERGIFP
jgi:hypothetical protein